MKFILSLSDTKSELSGKLYKYQDRNVKVTQVNI